MKKSKWITRNQEKREVTSCRSGTKKKQGPRHFPQQIIKYDTGRKVPLCAATNVPYAYKHLK